MRKHFPAGTFVPTPLRVLAIIQLCVVFTYIAWAGGYPFLGEIYEIKVMKQKYESVMEDSHYESLPEGKKAAIIEGYESLQMRTATSFVDKLENSLRILFIDSSVYSKVWVFLSIVLPIFILLRIEGAVQCVWLLPIVVSCGFFTSLGRSPVRTEEEKLFPTEQLLVNDYRGKALQGGILEQKEQLQEAWDRYLVKFWLKEDLSTNLEKLSEQKSRGQFLFNVARVEAVQSDGFANRSQYGSGLWLLFVIWNLCWAAGVQYNVFKLNKANVL